MTNLKLFEATKVRSTWNEKEEKWYFSIQDVLLVLTGSSDIKQYIKKLKSRDPELSNKGLCKSKEIRAQIMMQGLFPASFKCNSLLQKFILSGGFDLEK